MKSWWLIVPFLAIVVVLNKTESDANHDRGLAVYFSVNDPTLVTEQQFHEAKSLMLKTTDHHLVVDFANLTSLWKNLPDANVFSSGSHLGYRLFFNQMGSPSQEVRPQRPLPSQWISYFRHLQFTLAPSACRYLDLEPRTFNCEREKKNGEIAVTHVHGVRISLTHLSSAIFKGGVLLDDGDVKNTGVYVVQVGLRFGDNHRYEFALYTKPEYVQSLPSTVDGHTAVAQR